MLVDRQRRLLVVDVVLERERRHVQRGDLLVHGAQLLAQLRGHRVEVRDLP